MPESTRVGFEIEVRTKLSGQETDQPEPFRIAVFGDFSGRANRGIRKGAMSARPIAIDRDNFDQVLKRFTPSLEIQLAGDADSLSISFTSLDDFHPDSLVRRLPSATKRVMSEPQPPELQPEPARPPAPAPTGDLLSRMLEETELPKASRKTTRSAELQAFLDQAVAGHLVPGRNPQQDELAAQVDAAAAADMRTLLHHADFQALEAAWRGVFFLAQRLETGADLQIHLFDVSKDELRDEINDATDLRATSFYRHVVNTPGEPWALLIGDFSFDAQPEDIELLARIALTAHQAGAPFLAAAHPTVLGCELLEGMPDPRDWRPDTAAAQFWQTLRELPEASSVGLLMPRFLLRLPYGKDTNPTEEFPFEEMQGPPVHAQYLWGNPAIAGACLLGQSFSEDGWELRPGSIRQLAGMPLHIYKLDGESHAQPCAEAWLSDYAAESVLKRGIMPLLSARDSDRIQLVRFQSIADPPRALAGRW